MASTYSQLKIELIGTGDQDGTWGTTTNVNLGTALEEAIVGRANAIFSSDANLTISLTNTNGTQVARNYILNVTSVGSLTATRDLIVPTINKPYIIENNTSGGQSIVVRTALGTGVTVPNGFRVMVYANGTNVVQAQDYIPTLTVGVLSATTLGSALDIASGGTGATTAANARTNLGVPSLTGSGASGTWNISISGNAATATSATSATNATNATNATRITNSGGWNVTPSGTNLYFNYNGTNVGVLDSSGNFTVLGNVTAYGTI